MESQTDVVVVGAGHNGLTAAAYLARAGLSVAVVEAADRVGGWAVTDEPLLPGFRHNPHANVLIFCDLMPAMDELGLARHGLATQQPEAQLGVAFADGRPPVILHRHDLVGRTAANLAVYSPADARAWRELKRRSAFFGPLIRRGLYTPPSVAWFDEQAQTVRRTFGDMCSAATLGRRSVRTLVDDLFRRPEVRMLFYHLALECGLALEEPGGDIAFLGLAVWIAGRWRLPVGGMQSFSDALGRAALDAGADVRLAAPVRRVLVEGGAAAGVELVGGAIIKANTAVVAAAPIMDLFTRLVDPAAVSKPERTELARLEQERGGTVATSVFCLSAPPQYRSARHDPEIDRCLKTIVGHDSPEDVVAYAAEVAQGLLPRPAGAVRVNSLWDASQAPDGRHVAGVDSLFPPLGSLNPEAWTQVEESFPEAFLEVWSRYAENIGPQTVLASACDATARFERRMLLRFGDAQYRTSVPQLYMCGPGAFPGGGVHGACGYNAAQIVAHDLGMTGSPVPDPSIRGIDRAARIRRTAGERYPNVIVLWKVQSRPGRARSLSLVQENDMKLLRYEEAGAPRLGVLRGTEVISLHALGSDYPTMLSIVAGGAAALDRVREVLAKGTDVRALSTVRLLAPIERPGKYLAIGMNYKKHVEESARAGVAAPSQQLWFNKQTTCIVGPYDDIDPGVTEKLDYEVELGAVIGRKAKRISEIDARDYVFGYFVANDVSARDWQFHTPTFTMGKSFDTHGPIGPWIVTADEVGDPHALTIRCLVNGEKRQEASTGDMLYNLWKQIAYLSTAFTLEPGDLIATGTPEGVGAGQTPPAFLQPGDVVRCEIDGIGAIENKVIAPAA